MTLNRYQAFTLKTTETEIGYTGYHAVANKAITVVAGNLNARNPHPSGLYTGPYITSLPGVKEYGQEYVVPPLGRNSNNGGYVARLLAAYDGTNAYIGGEEYALDEGEWLDAETEDHNEPMHAYCDQPCIIVQMTKQATGLGYVMMNTVPVQTWYSAATFATREIDVEHYLSVTFYGDTDDFFLDGEVLNVNWTRVESFWTTFVDVQQGSHDISSQYGIFAAYVYAFTGNWGGYGYALLKTGTLYG